MQVIATSTPESAESVLSALFAAGVPLSGVRIVAAQSAFETAWWGKGLWNYNLGNLTTGASTNPNGNWQQLPGNSLKFRAYASLAEGADDFIAFLGKIRALPFAANGDERGYTQRICDSGYMGSTSTPIGQQSCDNLKAFMPGAVAKLQNVQIVQPPVAANRGGGSKGFAIGAALALLGFAAWMTYDERWPQPRHA